MWPIMVMIDDYRGILGKNVFFLLLDERGRVKTSQREHGNVSDAYLEPGL